MVALCNLVSLPESTFLMRQPIRDLMEIPPTTEVSLGLRGKPFLLARVQMEAAAAAQLAPRPAALARVQHRVAQIQEPQETLQVQAQEAVWAVEVAAVQEPEEELAAVWEPAEELAQVVRLELEEPVAAVAAVALVETAESVAVEVAAAANNLRVAISMNSTQLKVREATASVNRNRMRTAANRVIRKKMIKMTMETISRVAAGSISIRVMAHKVAKVDKAAKAAQLQLAELVRAEELAPEAEVVLEGAVEAEVVLEEAPEAAVAAHRAA
jgi:hypothetical protein